jgi:hypothetical protein
MPNLKKLSRFIKVIGIVQSSHEIGKTVAMEMPRPYPNCRRTVSTIMMENSYA